jgi:cell division protein FtsB
MRQTGPAATPIPPAKTPLGRRIVIFVCAIAAVALLIMTATGDRGYLESRRRRAAYTGLQQEVEKMNADNAALLAQITALKKQPYVIEKLAREELGYARPGEVIYLFPPETEPTQAKP